MIRDRPWALPLIALALIALVVFAANMLNRAPEPEAVLSDPTPHQTTPRHPGAGIRPAPDPAVSAGVAPSPGMPANSAVPFDPYDARFYLQVQAAVHRSSTP